MTDDNTKRIAAVEGEVNTVAARQEEFEKSTNKQLADLQAGLDEAKADREKLFETLKEFDKSRKKEQRINTTRDNVQRKRISKLEKQQLIGNTRNNIQSMRIRKVEKQQRMNE